MGKYVLLSADNINYPPRKKGLKEQPLLETEKSHRNLQPFSGNLSQDVDEYIEKIEHIRSLTKKSDEVLHVLRTEKLSGQAEKWYKDNHES
jgi:hypothetical protein